VSSLRLTRIVFKNFKALGRFSVSLTDTNIMVGPNNSGKSTIITSLRILEVALRTARSRRATMLPLPGGGRGTGHIVQLSTSAVSGENISTNYNDEESTVEFFFNNRSSLILFFPPEGGCTLHWSTSGTAPDNPVRFRAAFPLKFQLVPVLGPLEQEEKIVAEETVRNSLNTHRASRHFRNYWRYFPEGWEEYSRMISTTWPGMQLSPPELLDQMDGKLTLFVSENRIDREICWSGFGFQVWCQLLTHISRASDGTLIVIDEPEIYLHPDVQRQLLGIIRKIGVPVLLATHSVEIMGEADPSEILLIDKSAHSAQRLKDVNGIQLALDALGSAQNVTLAHMARTRKVLFVEGLDDFKIIRRFAQILGFDDVASGNSITPFKSGGFSSWERIKAFAWGLTQTMDTTISIGAVFDRDYFCEEHIDEIISDLGDDLMFSHIHKRKEMENYLLKFSVIERTIEKNIQARESRSNTKVVRSMDLSKVLEEITAPEKHDCQSQYIAKKQEYFTKTGKNSATLAKESLVWFEEQWENLETRLTIVGGKKILKALRDRVQTIYSVNLTDYQLIDSFENEDIDADIIVLVNGLREFQNAAS